MSFLLIPGTGATSFKRGDGQPASYVLEIAQGKYAGWTPQLVAELSCEHPAECDSPWAPSRTSLTDPAASLAPREVLHATAYPVVKKSKYAMYPYDWRLDIRHNATLLLEYLRRQTEPVNVLTHSQGGLVLIAASLLCADAAEFHELVGRVSLVAPPLMGTINSMDAMINGRNFGNTNSEFYRAASRTWPALFQMFPQWACVSNHPAKRSTSKALWNGENDSFYAMLDRTKGYLDWIDYRPFRNMERGRIMVVLGESSANTDVSVTATDGSPVIDPRRVSGETLVPYDITFKHLDDLGLRNRVMTVGGNHAPAHMRLLGDVRVYSDCDRFLSLPI